MAEINNTDSEGLYRFGGMYGSAWRGTTQLAEVVEVTATVEVNRIEVPLVGQLNQGYKPGRVSREGSIRIQEMDDAWRMEVWEFLNMSISDRRKRRDANDPVLKPFTIVLEMDDPDALGLSQWALDGCLVTWRMQMGFSITDDILDREYPLTWTSERPVEAFKRSTGTVGGQTVPVGQKLYSAGTKVT